MPSDGYEPASAIVRRGAFLAVGALGVLGAAALAWVAYNSDPVQRFVATQQCAIAEDTASPDIQARLKNGQMTYLDLASEVSGCRHWVRLKFPMLKFLLPQ